MPWTKQPPTHQPVERRETLADSIRGKDQWFIERTAVRLHYTFRLHQHPYVNELTQEFIDGAVPRLQAADTERTPPFERDFFKAKYTPAKAVEDYAPAPVPEAGVFVTGTYPRYTLDFSPGSPYAVYNWEIFFHAPLAIAVHLSRNQRFAEARDWLHYIFDPTEASDEPLPRRYWKFKEFKTTSIEQLTTILTNLSTGADPQLLQATVDAIHQWRESPFSPHVVARARPSMYMEKTVMVYLDNLIAWGDFLFQQDATEAIDEAASHYLMAAKLLGPRPQPVPKAGTVRPQTYEAIRASLDEFSNVLEETESEIPFDLVPGPTTGSAIPDQSPATDSLGRSLYFCVPHNEKLLEYWDTVADRLYKIRNSLNIRGIFRELPLFDPPIDPAMLARAAAAGVDVAAVAAGLNQPLPSVRFVFLVQKAMTLCQGATSLATQLLGAIEKGDNETLTLMRMRHEQQLLELAEAVRYGQVQEAGKQLEALQGSLDSALQRYIYFERLLGRQVSEITLPEFAPLDSAGLLALKLKSDEPRLDGRDIEVDLAQNAVPDAGGKVISRHEAQELMRSAEARDLQTSASVLALLGGILGLIPQFDAHGTPMGVGAAVGFGGVQLGQMTNFLSSAMRIGAELASSNASLAAKIGGFARREQEWAYQSNTVAAEIGQIYKQLRAAEIRKALAEREWHNHKKQMENAREVEAFFNDELNGKQANQALYAWMKRELRGLYSRTFSYALEVAGKAQRALQHELGAPELRYLSAGYTSGKEKLLAGERLMADLQKMEIEFHENHPPTLKPLVHVSLGDLEPLALLQLRATGRCSLSIPEALLDRTGAGEYFRRIKSVAVTIPCVVGPYAGVHCKLTLRTSTIRRTALLPDAGGGYTREGADDPRFEDFRGMAQSVLVSTGLSDTGTVDDGDAGIRTAPFEHHGVIGEWDIQLPADPSKGEPTAFDYGTITDVVLSIRYTARDGGERLRRAAMDALVAMLQEMNAAGAGRVFSIRHDFPDAWARFKATPAAADAFAPLEVTLADKHYPYWAKKRLNTVTRSMLLSPDVANPVRIRRVQGDASQDDIMNHLLGDAPLGIAGATLTRNAVPSPIGTTRWLLSDNSMSDLWLFVGWQE